jgi:hypothetical protein
MEHVVHGVVNFYLGRRHYLWLVPEGGLGPMGLGLATFLSFSGCCGLNFVLSLVGLTAAHYHLYLLLLMVPFKIGDPYAFLKLSECNFILGLFIIGKIMHKVALKLFL